MISSTFYSESPQASRHDDSQKDLDRRGHDLIKVAAVVVVAVAGGAYPVL